MKLYQEKRTKMKIHYTRSDGTQSFYEVAVIKLRHGFKPMLKTPQGLCYTLYRGKNIAGFKDKNSCLSDAINTIRIHKENAIVPAKRPRKLHGINIKDSNEKNYFDYSKRKISHTL